MTDYDFNHNIVCFGKDVNKQNVRSFKSPFDPMIPVGFIFGFCRSCKNLFCLERLEHVFSENLELSQNANS